MDLSAKVIPFWGRHKKADEINCAVVQFDIKNGVAVSKAFVFDSQIGILSATGDTNLGTEQVNFLLHPRPKDFSLVNLSTKMRVTGTLMDPKVRPDTLSLVKRGAEEVLGALALGESQTKVTHFLEKPDGDGAWINGGYFAVEPQAIDSIDGDEISWEQQPLSSIAHQGKLSAYKHDGFWQPMDTLRDKQYLESLWHDRAAPWKIW